MTEMWNEDPVVLTRELLERNLEAIRQRGWEPPRAYIARDLTPAEQDAADRMGIEVVRVFNTATDAL